MPNDRLEYLRRDYDSQADAAETILSWMQETPGTDAEPFIRRFANVMRQAARTIEKQPDLVSPERDFDCCVDPARVHEHPAPLVKQSYRDPDGTYRLGIGKKISQREVDKAGGHAVVQDGNAEPVCACGWNPMVNGRPLPTSQIKAYTATAKHVRDQGSTLT